MKRLVLAGVALGFIAAGPAVAADMPAKAPMLMKAPPMAYSWTGCYLDAGAGYGMWNQDHSTTTNFGGVPTSQP
jgi:outer membrane immunogenic protein